MVSDDLEQYPVAWQTREPFEMFGQYKDDPDALLERIFTHPHGTYWYFFWDVGDP